MGKSVLMMMMMDLKGVDCRIPHRAWTGRLCTINDAEEHQAPISGLGEVGPSSQSKLLVSKDEGHVRNEVNLNKNSSKILHVDQINQKTSVDVTKQGCEDVPYVKRRDRRPNSKLRVEEGYDFSWLPVDKSHSKTTRTNDKFPENGILLAALGL
ncbi:Hypothetical predicted protein [Olea europaea subsp. europaea]|uniref:Uncharacterized protein n=1 Tax=Olea europaea subsp. europaea TaxID=158383 RepID=A0A8S0UUE3_OLEEU|nr:Hypothetical predicted protein [Olea europaea subsp. europaea]